MLSATQGDPPLTKTQVIRAMAVGDVHRVAYSEQSKLATILSKQKAYFDRLYKTHRDGADLVIERVQ